MTPFIEHNGIAAPMLHDNIDTDQIIPSREMTSVSKIGLSDGLFAGKRYVKGRDINPSFILNQKPFDGATILLAGKNFGCGSSREHAVWALKEYGFRVIIAESFGDIFYNNCVRNGIVPIQMRAGDIASLVGRVTVNLGNQTVNDIVFEIAQSDKVMLMEGLDMIGQTLIHEAEIEAFFKKDKAERAWKY